MSEGASGDETGIVLRFESHQHVIRFDSVLSAKSYGSNLIWFLVERKRGVECPIECKSLKACDFAD